IDKKADHGETNRRKIEQLPERRTAEQGRSAQPDGSTGRGQVGGAQAQDLCECDRGKREVRTAQPKNNAPDDGGKSSRNQSGQQQGNPNGTAVCSEQSQPVRSNSKERHMPQRKLSGITAHQVPGQTKSGEQHDSKENLQQVIVVNELGHQRAGQREGDWRYELQRAKRISERSFHLCFSEIPSTCEGSI